jgi:leukotriene-A4 hydrolase
MARLDPHSYTDSAQPQVRHFAWTARADFAARVLTCEVVLHFREPGAGPLDLDTRALDIDAVTVAGVAVPFELDAAEPILGRRLRIALPAGSSAVSIRYRTRPESSALQWLEPAQTAGERQPFCFSQCQALHARSVIPLPDTPRVRLTYEAALTAPAALRVLMAAGFVDRQLAGAEVTERWSMPQRVPPYLLAFAIGDLASRELGPRSRVWAEPSLLDAAAHEFAGAEAMLAAGEALLGPYDWERWDLLVMPPSFPYGGMENPRLTFLTPTLLAGDRSLVNVVGHELAHAWTGNLVTNASAEHIWLNEGFTVYAERRLLEVLEGREVAELHAALGRRLLERAIQQFVDRPQLTALRTHLAGVDPDEIFSLIPYEKGYLLLRALEEAAGRPAFDGFLKRYLAAHRWKSVTTEEFVAFVLQELPAATAAVDLSSWIDGPGLPPGAPQAYSERLREVEAVGARVVAPEQAARWTPAEWQLYLERMPRPAPEAVLVELESRYRLSQRTNMEILVSFLVLAAESGFSPALPRTQEVLGAVGRMKYLRPLYQAMASQRTTRALAQSTFDRCRSRYHPIADRMVEGLLAQARA